MSAINNNGSNNNNTEVGPVLKLDSTTSSAAAAAAPKTPIAPEVPKTSNAEGTMGKRSVKNITSKLTDIAVGITGLSLGAGAVYLGYRIAGSTGSLVAAGIIFGLGLIILAASKIHSYFASKNVAQLKKPEEEKSAPSPAVPEANKAELAPSPAVPEANKAELAPSPAVPEANKAELAPSPVVVSAVSEEAVETLILTRISEVMEKKNADVDVEKNTKDVIAQVKSVNALDQAIQTKSKPVTEGEVHAALVDLNKKINVLHWAVVKHAINVGYDSAIVILNKAIANEIKDPAQSVVMGRDLRNLILNGDKNLPYQLNPTNRFNLSEIKGVLENIDRDVANLIENKFHSVADKDLGRAIDVLRDQIKNAGRSIDRDALTNNLANLYRFNPDNALFTNLVNGAVENLLIQRMNNEDLNSTVAIQKISDQLNNVLKFNDEDQTVKVFKNQVQNLYSVQDEQLKVKEAAKEAAEARIEEEVAVDAELTLAQAQDIQILGQVEALPQWEVDLFEVQEMLVDELDEFGANIEESIRLINEQRIILAEGQNGLRTSKPVNGQASLEKALENAKIKVDESVQKIKQLKQTFEGCHSKVVKLRELAKKNNIKVKSELSPQYNDNIDEINRMEAGVGVRLATLEKDISSAENKAKKELKEANERLNPSPTRVEGFVSSMRSLKANVASSASSLTTRAVSKGSSLVSGFRSRIPAMPKLPTLHFRGIGSTVLNPLDGNVLSGSSVKPVKNVSTNPFDEVLNLGGRPAPKANGEPDSQDGNVILPALVLSSQEPLLLAPAQQITSNVTITDITTDLSENDTAVLPELPEAPAQQTMIDPSNTGSVATTAALNKQPVPALNHPGKPKIFGRTFSTRAHRLVTRQ